MQWRKIFNFSISMEPPQIPGEPRPTAAEQEVRAGVFITPQSLVTFPVSTFVVGMVWKIIEILLPQTKNSLWVPLVLSFMLGIFIFFVGVTDPNVKLKTRDIVIAFVVAIINSFYLFASTTGIINTVTPGEVP